jgi:lysozyme family protein
MSDRFSICLPITLAYEGGFTLHRADPGNWTGGAVGRGVLKGTNMGISAKAFPNLDIKNLKLADVAPIYRRNYWDAAECGRYLPGADLVVFDGGVMSGVSRSITWAKSVKAGSDAKSFVAQYCDIRLGFLKRLTTFKTFGSGWSKRVASIRAKATTMALAAMGVTGAAAAVDLKAEALRAEGKAANDARKATSAAAPAAASPAIAPAAGIESTSGWVLIGFVAVIVLGAAAFLFIRARNRRDEAEAFHLEAANV